MGKAPMDNEGLTGDNEAMKPAAKKKDSPLERVVRKWMEHVTPVAGCRCRTCTFYKFCASHLAKRKP